VATFVGFNDATFLCKCYNLSIKNIKEEKKMLNHDEILLQAQTRIAQEKRERIAQKKAQREAMSDLKAEAYTPSEVDALYKSLRQW